jgi:hypothetical protein
LDPRVDLIEHPDAHAEPSAGERPLVIFARERLAEIPAANATFANGTFRAAAACPVGLKWMPRPSVVYTVPGFHRPPSMRISARTG